ncbi:C2 domain-containing protein 3 [Patella vulgata]|uniref:C2 domain-containing protein 3 n=1 Tax=Patella vulgata TaxID=6465 RepID=UPI0024A807B7|nr:C2 domain-containing protein 3 [Patella vulgata]
MPKKKGKVAKTSNKRGESWSAEDVKVHTSLPPQVDGQLRCFCKVSVEEVIWNRNILQPPEITQVRIKWWGESGEGAVFKPVDVFQNGRGNYCTTARYPVRSGLKQFTSYLNDMGCMTLEVLTSPMAVPVGVAEISEIGLLSNLRSIHGIYPVFSPNDDQIAELKVSIMLEPLMESYDSMGSIPTTDISMETYATQESALPHRVLPEPYSHLPPQPDDDLFISPASHINNDSRRGETSSSLRYADDLRQTLNYDLPEVKTKDMPAVSSGSTVSITANGEVVTTRTSTFSPPSKHIVQSVDSGFNSVRDTGHQGESDVLSVLLNRGNKLREAMIVSTLPNSTSTDNNTKDIQIRQSSSNDLFKDILPSKNILPVASTSSATDIDGVNTVDLVVGSHVGSQEFQKLQQMVNGRSPGSSFSSDPEVLSDPCDPLQEQDIINELFYKYSESDGSALSDFSPDEEIRATRSRSRTKSGTRSRSRSRSKSGSRTRSRSNSVSSLKDAGNARPASRRSSVSTISTAPVSEPAKKKTTTTRSKSKTGTTKKLKRRGSKKRLVSKSRSRGSSVSDFSDSDMLSTPRSETSRVSFDMMDSDLEDATQDGPVVKKTIDGLSVERLTLLGRVHVARVTIDSIDLNELNSSIVSRKSSKSVKSGKPPRPASKTRKHSTYFIEYQFPVVATSRDKYSPNTMATEVMRVASKNIKDGVVSFNHRSVFPIMFDGASVDKWWKSALVFKIFAREPGQKTPTPIGSCGLPLKSILRSDGLFLNKSLEVRETGKTGSQINGSFRGSGTVLGYLKAGVELASDHKDFATALARTKIAEISGKSKIIPLPQPTPPPLPPVPSDNIISDLANHIKQRELEERNKETIVTSQPSNQMQQDIPENIPSTNQNIPPAVNQYRDEKKITNQSEPQNHTNQAVYQLPLRNPNIPLGECETLTLNMMLYIPDGRNMTSQGIPPLHVVNKRPVILHQQQTGNRDLSTRNTYLVCRMFWCDDAVTSNVCWGTTQPNYNFLQVAPVLITPSLLERMRNNFMVIEVWDKKTTAENDKLIGIIKLSLHQFFMSFRERRIANALIKSQYPVVAVDNYLPVLDLFTGYQFGQIHVLLAMGTAEQVALLQRQKMNDNDLMSVPERPNHHLEREDIFSKEAIMKSDQVNTVEHCFELSIEGIKDLKLFENMIWGEADCFIQYHFPTQLETDGVKYPTPTLRSYRTGTTLCIPDPVFNDGNRHRISLQQGTPVQRELLTACANSGGGSGGLPFEVWCRYYHPNVRDQVIAKATLPLAKLCAMVTMQKRGEPSVQTFSLPLSQVAMGKDPDSEAKATYVESGMLDITLHYKSQVIKKDVNINTTNTSINTSNVCIAVGVIKATGLKAAADHVARLDESMKYPAEVGVNTYIRIKLSFLQQGERLTKTIARTFAPEFSHYLDFPCPLLFTQPLADAKSLAEILESAEAVFEVWHQVPGSSYGQNPVDQSDEVSGKVMSSRQTCDTLLGTTTVALYPLLARKTGLIGWFPINRPTIGWNKSTKEDVDEELVQSESSECVGLKRVVGGLELSIQFAQRDDRERVISAGRSVGWSPIDNTLEQVDWDLDGELRKEFERVKINVERIYFPLQNALVTGQTTLDHNARCYIRYKFYDKGAVISKNVPLTTNDACYLVTNVKHQHNYILPKSSTYQWYLQEEKLEIQVWVTYSRKNSMEKRPTQRDKLIGSAYVELSELCKHNRTHHRISGIYPLYKPGSNNMGGSCIQVQIKVQPHKSNQQNGSDEEDMNAQILDTDQDYDSQDSFHQLMSGVGSSPDKRVNQDGLTDENSFIVHISIERAMHLPTVTLKDRSGEIAPSTYVSYQTCEGSRPICTDIVPTSVNPVWDHNKQSRLPNTFFQKNTSNLVFKVWHKPQEAARSPDKSSDRVLGFVSVDLSPLSSGLLQICGWYNILDFNGQCQGQMKVNITPETSVSPQRIADASFYSSQINSSVPSIPTFTAWTSTYNSATPDTSSIISQRHLEGIRRHHQQINEQLHHRIATKMDQSVMSQQRTNTTQHWNPNFSLKLDENSSKSFLFSSLRQQLEDLDTITENFKHRLNHQDSQSLPLETETRVTSRNTKSGSSLVDSREHYDVTNTVIDSNNESSQSAVDSGAFSGDNLCRKSEDANQTRTSNLVTFTTSVPQNTSNNFNDDMASCASIRNNFNNLINAHPVLNQNEAVFGLPPLASRYQDTTFDAENSTGFIPKTHIPSEMDNIHSSSLTESNNETWKGTSHREDSNFVEKKAGDRWESGDEESEEEKFGSYHRYREMLDDEDGAGFEEDDGEEVITPRAPNDFSGFYAKNRESANNQAEEDLNPADILAAQSWPIRSAPLTSRNSDTFGQTSDETGQSNTVIDMRKSDISQSHEQYLREERDAEETPQNSVSRVPYSGAYTIDSWLSDDGNEINEHTDQHEHDLLETIQSVSDTDQPINHLLSNVELIDTLTSTAEKPLNLGSSTEKRVFSRNMLSRVELESVDSGTTHHPDSSSSKASRQSSAQSRESRKVDHMTDHQPMNRQTHTDPHKDERPQSESTPRSNLESHDMSHDEGVVTSRTEDLDSYFNQGQNRQLIYSMSSDDSHPFQFSESLKLAGNLSPLNSHRLGDMSTARNIDGFIQTEVHSDRTTDSGLESATKSSQDEKETFSMLDSTLVEKSNLPNFFPGMGELQASMKALQMATSAATYVTKSDKLTPRSANKAQAASELAARLATKNKSKTISAKGRQLPTADEAKRIAKIFSAKLS